MGLHLQLDVFYSLGFGKTALALIVSLIVLSSHFDCTKQFGKGFHSLIGIGTSICGSAAIVAVLNSL